MNDEPITEGEFTALLKERHSRRATKSGMEKDFRGLLEDMIAERLIIQEGLRMGLDQEADIAGQLAIVEKSAAADLLVRTEVKEKVVVTEKDVRSEFEKLFAQVHLRQIVTKTREEAEAVLKEIQGGADFAELAKERSVGYKAKDGGDLGTFAFMTIYPPLEEGVSALKVGETSHPIEAPDGFHVIRLEERVPADPEKWPKVREKVEARVRAKKEADRLRAFVDDLLKDQKVTVNDEVLEKVDRQFVLSGFPENPGESVAEVAGTSIPMEFLWRSLSHEVRMMTVSESDFAKLRDKVLGQLVDRVILRKEAERRKLTERPEVQRRVQDRLDTLVRRKFIGLVIVPKIDRGEEALRAYYEENQEDYQQSGKVRLARFTTSAQEKAAELKQRVNAGTNFEWLVEHESEDPEDIKERGGDLGWITEDRLSPALKKALAGLPIGGMSDPLKLDSNYHVYYVKDKQSGPIEPFESVRRRVYRDYTQKEVESALSSWGEKLRSASEITINEELLKRYEESFKSVKK